MPSFRGSSQPRDPTHVSCIAGRFFTPEPPRKPHKDHWRARKASKEACGGFCLRASSRNHFNFKLLASRTEYIFVISSHQVRGIRLAQKVHSGLPVPSYETSQPNTLLGFLGGSMVRNPPANAGDAGLVPESGGFPGGGNGNPLLYSCLGNPMDRGVWQVTVHGVGHDLATEERQQMLCHSSPSKLTSW